jgi:hypothetical protein
VHPAVLTAYLDGTLFQGGAGEPESASSPAALRREEAWVLALLRRITLSQPCDQDVAEQQKIA